MSDRRTPIPTPNTGNANTDAVLRALKTNVDVLTGETRGSTRLVELDPATATPADCANLLNAIVRRLQGTRN